MRTILFIALSVALSVFSACSIQTAESYNPDAIHIASPGEIPAAPSDTKVRQPVLVELFTSEGCSSCPPADRELTFLETQQPVAGADVITLAFHVDYWDSSAWKDTLALAEFSARQENYTRALRLDSNYTPQMVVDGTHEFVGSNSGRANEAISKSISQPKGTVNLGLAESALKINIDQIPKHEAATVYLVAAEDRITTNVRGGENDGRSLAHTSVVRKLQSIGPLSALESNYKTSVDLPTNVGWKKENLKYVVFVQEDASKKILAVGRASATK